MSLLTKDSGIPLEMKAVGDDGTIEGYGSVFGNIDIYGEMVMPGAFTPSLVSAAQKGIKIKMLWQHDSEQPIGVWDDLAEDKNPPAARHDQHRKPDARALRILHDPGERDAQPVQDFRSGELMSGVILAASGGGYAPIVVTCSDLYGNGDFSTTIYSASADGAATGGSGSFTWSWTYSSGDGNITPVSATSPFTQMKGTVMGPGATREAYYNLTATDTVTGQTGSKLVYVNISRGS